MGEFRMSCWVVPSVAAEFWGIPIAHVLERIRHGLVPFKTELGFTLVDVAPDSPRIETGFRAPAAAPPTYVPLLADSLTEAERDALAGDEVPINAPIHDEADVEAEQALAPDERFDWRPARRAASMKRRAPQLTQLAA